MRLALLDRPVDLVEEGLDAAIRIGTLADTSAIATRVGALRRVAVAAPGYLKRRGRPKMPRDLAAHDVIAFSGMDGIERWRFAGGVEAPDQAAADRQHRGGRDRRRGLGIRRHPRAELSGRRCDWRTSRWFGCCASTRVTKSRSMWFIPMAGIRRRSSAPFSMRWCRACGSVATRSPIAEGPHELRKRQHRRHRAGNPAGPRRRQRRLRAWATATTTSPARSSGGSARSSSATSRCSWCRPARRRTRWRSPTSARPGARCLRMPRRIS